VTKRPRSAPASAVAIYARVSTDEQRERQTIDTQLAAARTRAERDRLPIYDTYLDDGISGTIPLAQRPAGARLATDAAAGHFGTVLVYRVDRLGRGDFGLETLQAVASLRDLGVRVVSLTEHFDADEPSGRFMLAMLSAAGAFERDSIIQRSVDATARLAREGTWLGGIVPYGYRAIGKDREARLEPAESVEALPGLSEADVVRSIFDRAARGQSCIAIGEYLNTLGVPTAYVRDARVVRERGKREQATAGVWRPGRVLSILRSTTYRGIHQYGKRARTLAEVIERPVPALVSDDIWQAAQRTLERNLLFARRNARRVYLLRGLIKCAHCGLGYSGTSDHREPEPRVIYKCNGRQPRRGLLGNRGERCTSKAVYGDELEQQIWATVEGFLRQPETLLEELAALLQTQTIEADQYRAEAARLEAGAARKDLERELIMDLYRRGTIRAAHLQSQLAKIDDEEQAMRVAATDLVARAHSAEQATEHLRSTEALLGQLRARLDEPVTHALKRELIERFVERINVTTLDLEDGRRTSQVDVTYRFSVVATRTDTDCEPRSA
jgi:site-specific DNA recombinase